MTTEEKAIAAIWWRTSTKAQTESSPETQIREARELLEAAGYEVPDEFVYGSDWHSLSILECPAMEALLEAVRHGRVHAIGMYHGDRLAGNPGQKMFIVDLCDRKGVKLIAKYSPIMEGKEGELLEYVRTWGKEQQVIRAQQASKDGLRDRVLLRGLPVSPRGPYGYAFLRSEDGRYDYTRVVSTKDWAMAAFIWRRALEGVSLRRIIRELYERGIPTPSGKSVWSVAVIHGILNNPTYSGRYHALRRRAVTPKHRTATTYGKSSKQWKPMADWAYLPDVAVDDPIVTWAQFLHVQEQFERNKRFSPRNAKNKYLLRGMIFCETHGKLFNGRARARESGRLYICHSSVNAVVKTGERCVRQSIGGPTLENEVWIRARDLLSHPETVLGELNRRAEAKQRTEASVADALARNVKRSRANEGAEMELVALRIRGDVTEDVFQRQKALLKAEQTYLADESGRLQREAIQVRQEFVTAEQIHALRHSVAGKLEGADFDTKRMVLETLDTRVSVGPDGALAVWFSIPAPAVDADVDTSIVSIGAGPG